MLKYHSLILGIIARNPLRCGFRATQRAGSGIEVQRDILCFGNGEISEIYKFPVEIHFVDFKTHFRPIFDVVVFAMYKAVHELELSV